MYLTDVAGIYERWPDESSLLTRLDVDGLERLVDAGAISEGMIPKVASCVDALRKGVRARTHPRRPAPARAAPRVLHPRGHRNDGDAVKTYDEIAALDAQHVMQTYGRLPVAFVRGEGSVLWDPKAALSRLPRRARRHVARPRPPEVADAIADQAPHAPARLEPLLQRRPATGGRAPRRATRRRRTRVLRELRRRGQRVRDQARASLRPVATSAPSGSTSCRRGGRSTAARSPRSRPPASRRSTRRSSHFPRASATCRSTTSPSSTRRSTSGSAR